MPILLPAFGVGIPFDPQNRLISSPFYSRKVLAIRRGICAGYGLVALIVSLIYESAVLHDGNKWFSYFTNLTFIGLVAYYLTSAIHASRYTPSSIYDYPLQRWPRIVQLLHLVLLSTVTTLPILVTICFWAILVESSTFATRYNSWYSVSFHVFNAIFALLEILSTAMPPLPWIHLPLCLLILLCYLGMTYITHADQNLYVYSFLDPAVQHSKVAAFIIGIAVAEAAIFVLVHYSIVLREKLFPFESDLTPSLPHVQGTKVDKSLANA